MERASHVSRTSRAEHRSTVLQRTLAGVSAAAVVGAGLALVASYVVVLVLMYVFTQRLFPVPYQWGRLARVTFTAAALVGIGELAMPTSGAAGLPRIVEFHRNRDLYMRKHHGGAAALAVRILTAWSYAVRAAAATVLPGQPAAVYRAHARQALFPQRGESIRDRV